MTAHITKSSFGVRTAFVLTLLASLALTVACSNKGSDGEPSDSAPVDVPAEPDTPEPEDSAEPADVPAVDDSAEPTDVPAIDDSAEPADVPVVDDSAQPVDVPVVDDSAEPTDVPATDDSAEPADVPVVDDSAQPTDTPATPDVVAPPDVAATDTAGPDAGAEKTCDEIIPPPNMPAGQSGCSDSTREGFVSLNKFPKIAACGGAWDVGGIHNITPACNREAGNDGINPPGAGCNVSDLCAEGWHVCYGKVDVLERNPLGCGGIMECAQSPAFFLARTSSVGAFDCSQDSTKFGGPGTSNDLFGCGDLGCPTTLGKCSGGKNCDPLNACKDCLPGMSCLDQSDCTPKSCFPLTLGSHDLCKSIKVKPGCNCSFLEDDPNTPEDESLNVTCTPNSGGCGWCKTLNYWNKKLGLSLQNNWNCGSNTTQEANNVIKTDPSTQGGVLCCMDVVPTP
jgi:hypothetical protein